MKNVESAWNINEMRILNSTEVIYHIPEKHGIERKELEVRLQFLRNVTQEEASYGIDRALELGTIVCKCDRIFVSNQLTKL